MSEDKKEYRIVKDLVGFHYPQVKIDERREFIPKGYGISADVSCVSFWRKRAAIRYIKKMKRNGDRPLYYVWKDKDHDAKK